MPDFVWSIPVFSRDFSYMNSSGRAAGVNHEQTLLHGAYEGFEDFCLYGDINEDIIKMDKLDLSFFGDKLSTLFEQLNNENPVYLGVYDTPFGIPTYRVIANGKSGFGCNLDGGVAITRALLETLNSRGDKDNSLEETIDNFKIPNYSTGDAVLDLERFDEIMKDNNLMLDYANLSQKKSNLLVYKTFITRKVYENFDEVIDDVAEMNLSVLI